MAETLKADVPTAVLTAVIALTFLRPTSSQPKNCLTIGTKANSSPRPKRETSVRVATREALSYSRPQSALHDYPGQVVECC